MRRIDVWAIMLALAISLAELAELFGLSPSLWLDGFGWGLLVVPTISGVLYALSNFLGWLIGDAEKGRGDG